MNNQSLVFQSIQFDIVDRNGQSWLQASDIALALGYSSAKSVSTLYSRNSDELGKRMSLVIKVMTNGINNSRREKDVRIFSLRGAHLLAMFARTEKAKEFRKWVLDVLDKELENQTEYTPSLIGKRWLISFDHQGNEQIKPVPMDACVLSAEKFLQEIAAGGIYVPPETLFDFTQAAIGRLGEAYAFQAERAQRAS